MAKCQGFAYGPEICHLNYSNEDEFIDDEKDIIDEDPEEEDEDIPEDDS